MDLNCRVPPDASWISSFRAAHKPCRLDLWLQVSSAHRGSEAQTFSGRPHTQLPPSSVFGQATRTQAS